jgi:uncharacterized phage protein gp47/JayE
MSKTPPTLSQSITNISTDMFTRFPQLDPTIENSFARNLSEVFAGGVNGNYDYGRFVLAQLFVSTAVDESLELHAQVVGETRDPAQKSGGDIVFTGVIGSSVATGAELVGNTGIKYSVDTGFTLAAGSESHSVTALDSGAAGNVAAGGLLTFTSPPAGMDSSGTVDSGGLTGGTDRQSNESLRKEISFIRANPPQGGSEADYQRWVKNATSVTRSWVRTIANDAPTLYGDALTTTNQVWQYIAIDNTYSDGIPSAGDVTDVENYIKPIAPATVEYTCIAPTAQTVDFDLTIEPDSTEGRASAETEMKSTITNEGVVGGIIGFSSFQEAMTRIPNLTSWSINTIDGVAPADVGAASGSLHTLGTVIFS